MHVKYCSMWIPGIIRIVFCDPIYCVEVLILHALMCIDFFFIEFDCNVCCSCVGLTGTQNVHSWGDMHNLTFYSWLLLF